MKFYTMQEAQILIAFYSNVERIECEFELVRPALPHKGPANEQRVGILCIDKSSSPPLVSDIDEVVKGLDLTPTSRVLHELREVS